MEARSEARPFDPERFTNAPLRFERRTRLEAPPADVFAKIVDHHGMTTWVPMLRSIRLEHSAAGASGECGVGTVRHCSVKGMGGVDETIVHWDPPRRWAYRVSAAGIPTKDHLAVLAVEPDGADGTVLVWSHYLNYRGAVLRWIFPVLFRAMVDRALWNLRAEMRKEAPDRRVAGAAID